MRKLIPCIIILHLLLWASNPNLCAQDPVVQWDKTIGGVGEDVCNSICVTADGGYLIGAESKSGISGNKTELQIGGWDYWILKLDAIGNIEWQNTIGSISDDRLVKVLQTADGGYLIGGYTKGGISGDKTEASAGLEDYWIIKLNSLGGIVWQNSIGGSGADVLTNMELLPSGNFIVSGYSTSGISGDKTVASYGGKDYWVMKLNTSGSIVWQYGFGGTLDDVLVKTIRRSGNYFLSGYSSSDISGVKTENSNGLTDLWLLEITESGVINWQNTIGGDGNDYISDCMLNGISGYVLLCYSGSDISGDKSQLSFNNSYYTDILSNYVIHDSYDYWIIRLNGSGELLSEKTIGTTFYEYPKRLLYNDVNSLLIAGYYGDGESGYSFQICGIDSFGYLKWKDNIIGSSWENTYNYLKDAAMVPGNGFIIAGSSEDDAGFDKSEDAFSPYIDDIWILKMGPDTCTSFTLYTDIDQDGFGGDYAYSACEYSGSEFVANFNDCDDYNSNVAIDITEICDQIDNNCNGDIDEGIAECPAGPVILNDSRIGGEKRDYVTTSIPTTDGGFLLGGSSYSNTDDIVLNNGEMDFCIIKLNSSANIEWIKTYGGSATEKVMDIFQCDDTGFILGGYSYSGISGDKTEAQIGGSDYWIIKTDLLGNIIWQNTIGGTADDELKSIEQTLDGGFIVAGYSSSGISGDKSEPSQGSSDYWIIKLDASGNITWQNTIGGSSIDIARHVIQTSDGGYLIGGDSRSGISGDKTSVNSGLSDNWIIKLNSSGAVVWQKSFGGTNWDDMTKVLQTEDGNFLCGGSSASPNSATKTESSFGSDFWLIKLDPTGNIIWQNTINAEGSDILTDFVETDDHGLILVGMTTSDAGYDKYESVQNGYWNIHEFTSFYYKYDYWIVKINSAGGLVWQNNIGGLGDDYCKSVSVANDGKILLSGTSSSEVSGDKTIEMYGNIWEEMDEFDFYEEDVYFTDLDIWNILIEPEFCVPIFESCNAIDDNCNGLIDDGITETISISAGGPITFCQGGSVLLTATYTGASVQWKKNGTNIPGATSSTYSVTTKGNYTCVTTSACGTAESTTIFVNVLKNPNANISAGGPTTFCVGGSVVLTEVAVTGCTYQWYKGANPIAGATALSYTATTAGNYKCRVTKTATGCYKNSNAISITVPCKEGDEIINEEKIFSIYPNPNNGTFILSVHSVEAVGEDLEIYNSLGQLIYVQQVNSSDINFTQTISINNISSGIYFVRMGDTNNYTQQKLIIE